MRAVYETVKKPGARSLITKAGAMRVGFTPTPFPLDVDTEQPPLWFGTLKMGMGRSSKAVKCLRCLRRLAAPRSDHILLVARAEELAYPTPAGCG